MGLQINQPNENGKAESVASRSFSDGMHELNQQCLRILRCTARAMASSPGGLRFKPGTRPWLEGLVREQT